MHKKCVLTIDNTHDMCYNVITARETGLNKTASVGKENTMKEYFVGYLEPDGKPAYTKRYKDFNEAFAKYLELLKAALDTDRAKDVYRTTKIVTVYK